MHLYVHQMLEAEKKEKKLTKLNYNVLCPEFTDDDDDDGGGPG